MVDSFVLLGVALAVNTLVHVALAAMWTTLPLGWTYHTKRRYQQNRRRILWYGLPLTSALTLIIWWVVYW